MERDDKTKGSNRVLTSVSVMDKNFLDHERFTKLRDLINVSALDDERSVDSYFEGILRGASKRTPKGADITFSSSERESL